MKDGQINRKETPCPDRFWRILARTRPTMAIGLFRELLRNHKKGEHQ